MIINTTQKVLLVIAFTSLSGTLIWLGFALFYAYTKLDLMMDRFANSPSITQHKIFMNAGPWGRLHALGSIVGPLNYPKLYLQKGGVDASDLAQFPADMKRKLVLLHRTSWPLIGGIACVCIMVLAGVI